jgi:hypothetical protein
MQLRPLTLGVLLLAVAHRATAQEIRAEVVELSTGQPIVGAIVSVIDEKGASLFGRFSDESGQMTLRAPIPGTYRVRADKVGYITWTSVVLHLSPNPTHVRIGMSPRRVNLRTVVVRNETPCEDLGAAGTSAADLWGEMRTALTANELTESQGLVAMDIDRYDRALDRNLNILTEHVDHQQGLTRQPFRGLPGAQLDSVGYMRSEGSDIVYYAPDAITLLSDQFVSAHCFSVVRGYGQENGLLGLEFKPAKPGNKPDISGVLWLDPATSALRYLVFDYVNLPIPLRVGRARGRVEFQQLAGGPWIVPRWYIRMPRVARIRQPGLIGSASPRDTLLGYQEAGGSAAPARLALSSQGGTASTEQTELTGIVFDSTTGLPLKDVVITTGNGRYKTSTNELGRYALGIDGALVDSITFDHPRLRLFRVSERVQSVSLARGTHARISILIPSYATLRNRLCARDDQLADATGLAVGYVRDPLGKPVANAHVSATWPVSWVQRGGKLVATESQRLLETDTDSDGAYVLCGFTRGALMTTRVYVAGVKLSEEKILLPSSMTLERDIRLPLP